MVETPKRSVAIGILITTMMFVAIVSWLHVVRPDLDPARQGVSRYAAGNHGQAVTVGFALLSLALLLVASQFRGAFRCAMWTAAAGLVLLVLFPLTSSSPGRLEYIVHQLGGAVFFAAGTIGVQAVSSELRAASAPKQLQIAARVCALIAAIALVLFFTSVVARGSPLNGALGIFQRVYFASICAALVTFGCGLVRHHPRLNADVQGHRS